jgi:hypothetical protein
MKRITLALAVVFSFLALSAFAANTPAKAASHGTEIKGTVASLDDSAKSFVLNASGKDDTIYWTTATKVHGGPLKATQNVVVRAMEKDGKWIATSIKVEPMKAAASTKK